MELLHKRRWYRPLSTIGRLWSDGEEECWILEDTRRPDGIKVPKKTCIPPGRYEVRLTYSPAVEAGRLWSPLPGFRLPEIFNVPMFTDIRIHAGNDPSHTDGCLITGVTESHENDMVTGSRAALTVLCQKLLEAESRNGKVWITIEDGEDWNNV